MATTSSVGNSGRKTGRHFFRHDFHSLCVLRMCVPCCVGTSMIVRESLEFSGKDIPVEEKNHRFRRSFSNR